MLCPSRCCSYDPVGEKFDPNLHNALFEVPDATKEPGTVAIVIKVGWVACWGACWRLLPSGCPSPHPACWLPHPAEGLPAARPRG